MGILDGLIGGAVSGVGGIVQQGMQNRMTRETNAQNEALMRESWERDDTATQRRAADLEAAGLSKTLAAGGAAASSSPIKLESPQARNIGADVMAGAAASQQIASTRAQMELMRSQKDKLDSEKAGQDLQNQILADQKQYSTATLAWRIEQADNATLKSWYEALQSESKAAADRLNLGIQEYQLLIKKLESEIMTKYGMDAEKARVMALQAAADYAKYEADRYEDAGTIKGGVLPSAMTSWMAEFNNLMNKIGTWIRGGK